MKYSLKITPPAFRDIQDGIEYYNQQQNSLGNKFLSTIEKHFKKLVTILFLPQQHTIP